MKKIKLPDIYESPTIPTDTSVLWAEKDRQGDIKVIHRYIKGKWEPYLVSVDYLRD